MLRVEGLEPRVLGLEPDSPVTLAEEGLNRRLVRGLVVADEGDDHVSSARVRLLAHDDDVAVENAGLDHRVAGDAEQEIRISA